jgi:hypothetical protein
MQWLAFSLLLLLASSSSLLTHLSQNALHAYSEEVSRQLASSIKIKLYPSSYKECKTYR